MVHDKGTDVIYSSFDLLCGFLQLHFHLPNSHIFKMSIGLMYVYKVLLMPREKALASQDVIIRVETYHSKLSLPFIFVKFFNYFQNTFCIGRFECNIDIQY